MHREAISQPFMYAQPIVPWLKKQARSMAPMTADFRMRFNTSNFLRLLGRWIQRASSTKFVIPLIFVLSFITGNSVSQLAKIKKESILKAM